MADVLKILVRGIVIGFKDAVLGTVKIFSLDKVKENLEQAEIEGAKERETILARRRAEKVKRREQKQVQPKQLTQHILQCCAWNGGVFWLSIMLFYSLLLPALKMFTFLFFDPGSHNTIWSYIGPVLSWTFGALWIMPLFLLSKIVNGFWFQDIADVVYRKSRGRPKLPSIAKMVADVLFSILLQSLFLIQGMLVSLLPVPTVGYLVCLIHMCLLHSLYCFEYKWFNMGWEVQKRLRFIEANWPYFIGFGFPLAILTSLPASYVISGCVFSILFPLFIISANEAEPLENATDFHLQLFSPVVKISDSLFRHSVRRPETAARGSASEKTTPTSSPGKPAHKQ